MVIKRYTLPIKSDDIKEFDEIDPEDQIQLYDGKGRKKEWE